MKYLLIVFLMMFVGCDKNDINDQLALQQGGGLPISNETRPCWDQHRGQWWQCKVHTGHRYPRYNRYYRYSSLTNKEDITQSFVFVTSDPKLTGTEERIAIELEPSMKLIESLKGIE